MAAPVVQIVQVSDLHMIEPESLDNYLRHLSTLPTAFLSRQVLQREDYHISVALPSEVAALCRDLPSVVVVTGDISTWPGDTPDIINRHQYALIQNLPRPLYPVLGNHDWGPLSHATSYSSSGLQAEFNITAPRYEVFTSRVDVVLFLIDSNIRMFPSQGLVDDFTRTWLSGLFGEGRQGQLEDLSTERYANALKILLLHHMPLDREEYQGALGAIDYWNLQLRDRPGLLGLCKDDIDLMLFGHTHVPLTLAWNGFLMVNCGTTTGLGGWNGVNNLQRLTIYDDLSVDVQPFNWNGLKFVAQSSRRYARGVAPPGVLGSGRWG